MYIDFLMLFFRLSDECAKLTRGVILILNAIAHFNEHHPGKNKT